MWIVFVVVALVSLYSFLSQFHWFLLVSADTLQFCVCFFFFFFSSSSPPPPFSPSSSSSSFFLLLLLLFSPSSFSSKHLVMHLLQSFIKPDLLFPYFKILMLEFIFFSSFLLLYYDDFLMLPFCKAGKAHQCLQQSARHLPHQGRGWVDHLCAQRQPEVCRANKA